ncbi:MAG: hypothetical protein ACOYL6_16655 [Bacteriovoracaceae bacterium]
MKLFITLVTLIAVHNAFAMGFTPIEKNDLSITNAHAEIVSIQPLCPASPSGIKCMAYGSNVTIKVTLNGCVDRLGGYNFHFEDNHTEGVLYFGALNLRNKMSEITKCFEAPVKIISLVVPFEGKIELKALTFTGTTQPTHIQ